MRTRLLVLVAALTLAAAVAPGHAFQEPQQTTEEARPSTAEEVAAAVQALPPRYRTWLQTVAGLITPEELVYFLNLTQDYRRDAFMEAFWEPRDPDPVTPRNELRERWQDYVNRAGGAPFGDPRFILFLLNGQPGRYSLPNGQPVARCFSRTKELEIWFYDGSEITSRRFLVIFQKPGGDAPYEVYRLGANLRPVQRSGGMPTTEIQLLCADELLTYALSEISRMPDYDRLLEEVLTPPRPSPEWISRIAASATDMPRGAESFDMVVELRYPARRGSRTAVQVMLRIPLAGSPGRRFDGELFHNYIVVGEVIRNDRLFESFRYGFEGPTPDGATEVPLGFTRYLRSGTVTFRILVEDVFSGKYSQFVHDIEVRSADGLPTVPREVEIAEDEGGPSLRLVAPDGNVLVGMVRFQTRASGEFDKVTFYLDDKPVISKRRPPYSVELNLGEAPEAHRVRVVGFAGDSEVATDQIWLNQGNQRFSVRLVEPRPGGIYPGSLTARVDVTTPDGRPPERVEIYLDEELQATLDQEPYSQTLRLPGETMAVVKAVGYLADGSRSEDVVVVNAGAFTEAVEVRLVEVSALVLDRERRPVLGLEQNQFRLLEDGQAQRLERFEETAEAPISAALLIDRSASMEPHLDQVADAALTFARAAMTSEEDRVAVLSFADQASVDSGFGGGPGQIERALASLDANGGTALYDSLVQALNSFAGLRGQTALILFSDGKDESSRLTQQQALEAARRASAVIYAIGLEAAFEDRRERRVLEELADETGGRAFFLAGPEELGAAYAEILTELRSRYLLAYQSTSTKPDGELREIAVEVEGRGLEVRARRGYYP